MKETLVVFLVANRNPDPARNRTNGKTLLQESVRELFRPVDRNEEEIGVGRPRRVAELAQPPGEPLALVENRPNVGWRLERRKRKRSGQRRERAGMLPPPEIGGELAPASANAFEKVRMTTTSSSMRSTAVTPEYSK